MNKFKVGDKVQRINSRWSGNGRIVSIGDISMVTKVFSNGWIDTDITGGPSTSGNMNPGNLLLIESNNMNIRESFLLAFKSEPQKSFRLKGITNGDDFFTEDGQKIFLAWLLTQNGDAFKTEVVDKLPDPNTTK